MGDNIYPLTYCLIALIIFMYLVHCNRREKPPITLFYKAFDGLGAVRTKKFQLMSAPEAISLSLFWPLFIVFLPLLGFIIDSIELILNKKKKVK